MMSRSFFVPAAALIGSVLLAGVLPEAAAQQQQHIVLENIAAPSGTPSGWTGDNNRLRIPVSTVNLAGSGDLLVNCGGPASHATSANCNLINIGTSSGGSSSIPANTSPVFELNGPATNVTATGASLNWNVSNSSADTCFGLSATSAFPGAPSISLDWGVSRPASGTYSLTTLYNAVQQVTSIAAGAEVPYTFTLRCYSKTKFAVSNGDVVAAVDKPRTVTIVKSGTPPVDPGGDFCNDYKSGAAGYTYVAGAGMSFTGLQRMPVDFSVFQSFTGSSITFQQLIASSVSGAAILPGSHGNHGYYMSIPIDVPANTPNSTGFELRWFTPQDGGITTTPTSIEVTLSPCPGDFRVRPQNNSSPDYWNRVACRPLVTGDGGPVMFTTGNGTAPTSAGTCFLPKGKRMYLNMSMHSMNALRNEPSVTPASTCTNPTGCGFRFQVGRVPSL